MRKQVILITNDDGIYAPGLEALIEVAKEFAQVYVVAPDRERSAASHSITINRPLQVSYHSCASSNISYASVDGTPVDCVKIALNHILPKKPDLVLSGINFGVNMGQDVLYSGTIAAAMEASRHSCLAFAFSAQVINNQARFDTSSKVVEKLLMNFKSFADLSPSKVVNINIPHLEFEKIKGIKNTKVDHTSFVTRYEEYKDPRGKTFFWLAGARHKNENSLNTDCSFLKEGYVSISSLDNQYANTNKCEHLEEIIGQL